MLYCPHARSRELNRHRSIDWRYRYKLPRSCLRQRCFRCFLNPYHGLDMHARSTEAHERVCADCIFTGWSGAMSPLGLMYSGLGHIVDTVFRDMHLSVEIADVSDNGIVVFRNVSLANVTLTRGSIVTTTHSDYDRHTGARLHTYAADDEAYDVDFVPVPVGDRGMFGEDFVIVEATMSDCLFPGLSAGAVMPGCPQESAEKRMALLLESVDEEGEVSYDNGDYGGVGQQRRIKDLLTLAEPWLVRVQEALGPLPPPPRAWPPFAVDTPANPVVRTELTAVQPVPPGTLLAGLNRTAASAAAADEVLPGLRAQEAAAAAAAADDDGVSGTVVVAAAVAALLAVAVAAVPCAVVMLRRWQPRTRAERDAAVLAARQRRRMQAWVWAGEGTGTVRGDTS